MKKCIRCQKALDDNYPERMCPDCLAWLNEKTGGKGDVLRKPPASGPASGPDQNTVTKEDTQRNTGSDSAAGGRASDYRSNSQNRTGRRQSEPPKSKLPLILGIVAAVVVFAVLAVLLLNRKKPSPGPGTATVPEQRPVSETQLHDPELETYTPSNSSPGSEDREDELKEYISAIQRYIANEENNIQAGAYQEVEIRSGLVSYWYQDELVMVRADADEQFDADREFYYAGGDLLYAKYLNNADIYLTEGQIYCIQEQGGKLLDNSGDWGKWPGYVYAQEAVYREEASRARQEEADRLKEEEDKKREEEEEEKRKEEEEKKKEEEERKKKEEEEKKKKEEEEKKKEEEEKEKDEEKNSQKSFDETCRALSDRTFSDSDIKNIKKNAPDNLPERPYQMAINYLYAMHGYHFNTDSIREYFNKQSWYEDKGRDMGACEAEMSSTEKENKKKLEAYR